MINFCQSEPVRALNHLFAGSKRSTLFWLIFFHFPSIFTRSIYYVVCSINRDSFEKNPTFLAEHRQLLWLWRLHLCNSDRVLNIHTAVRYRSTRTGQTVAQLNETPPAHLIGSSKGKVRWVCLTFVPNANNITKLIIVRQTMIPWTRYLVLGTWYYIPLGHVPSPTYPCTPWRLHTAAVRASWIEYSVRQIIIEYSFRKFTVSGHFGTYKLSISD